ncbi:dihydrofolate reductase [Roseobacter ponti]|uniref:Dihydrofolate reductase n=1 Tax=Roseobacter ponti TaxID=1891787 RepID=A0A858SZ15_9RHOB|nr:dihydrofolate reductase [Roseobacter ponti]QJF52096.1 dihydrofolate reductase [Roseobacter ponti]
MLTLVVARARNGAIGKDNEIPWNVPEDLRLFQRETLGGALIMGRRTWQSLPVRPLPRRLNCVISRDNSLADMVRQDLRTAIQDCYDAGYTRIYGVGGEAVYAGLMPLADRMVITEVDTAIGEADAFFPAFDASDWTELRRFDLRTDSPACQVRELVRAASGADRGF